MLSRGKCCSSDVFSGVNIYLGIRSAMMCVLIVKGMSVEVNVTCL